jgi:hypothetical protein
MATRHHSRDVDGTTQRRRGEQGASFKFFLESTFIDHTIKPRADTAHGRPP